MICRARLPWARPFFLGWRGIRSGSFVLRSWWIMSAFVLHGARFNSSRRFSGFCGSHRGFYRLFDNFIGYGVKRASRGFCAVAPMAAYRRGLFQAFIRRFKRLLWLRGYFVRVTRLNAFVGLLWALYGAVLLAVWLALLSASPAPETLY